MHNYPEKEFICIWNHFHQKQDSVRVREIRVLDADFNPVIAKNLWICSLARDTHIWWKFHANPFITLQVILLTGGRMDGRTPWFENKTHVHVHNIIIKNYSNKHPSPPPVISGGGGKGGSQ